MRNQQEGMLMQFPDILMGHFYPNVEEANGSLIVLSQMFKCFVVTIHLSMRCKWRPIGLIKACSCKEKLNWVSDTLDYAKSNKIGSILVLIRPNLIPLLFHHGSHVGAHHEQFLTLYNWSRQSWFLVRPRIVKWITMAEMVPILLGMSHSPWM